MQVPRQLANRVEDGIGTGRANPLGSGKRAEDADGAYTCAARHFDILRSVSHIDAFFRGETNLIERQLQRSGVGLSFRGVFAANARGKTIGKREITKLFAYPRPIAAGDDTQDKFSLERADELSRPWHQPRIFPLVGESPDAVGFVPFGARKASGTVDAVPIRRIVASEIVKPPSDAQGFEHGEVGARVRAVGIDERAVPVK